MSGKQQCCGSRGSLPRELWFFFVEGRRQGKINSSYVRVTFNPKSHKSIQFHEPVFSLTIWTCILILNKLWTDEIWWRIITNLWEVERQPCMRCRSAMFNLDGLGGVASGWQWFCRARGWWPATNIYKLKETSRETSCGFMEWRQGKISLVILGGWLKAMVQFSLIATGSHQQPKKKSTLGWK